MQKFLNIPVTNEQNQLVAVSGIVLIEQASTTTVVITYDGGKATTITHATAGAGDETQRDAIQDAVVAALTTSWTNPAYNVENLPYAVSGIAVS
ncbi:MAG: hypothetical protein GY787_09030 [Alteromonadales bacterium]|jgi:hypothetical protein|nr:hypothetical protein [Alteromonadales bacterium]|tara:strand:- start:48 stop:329 length:282 start_codon:yes stop_codon:yes gene_type:complete